MKNTSVSIPKTALIYSGLTTLGLIVYFGIMKMVNLVHILELRFLNFFILLAGVLFALKYFKSHAEKGMTYFEGLAVGFLTSVFTSVFFGIFVYVYLSVLDPGFMNYIVENATFGEYMTPANAALVVHFEGASSGAIITFVFMQYFKKYTPRYT